MINQYELIQIGFQSLYSQNQMQKYLAKSLTNSLPTFLRLSNPKYNFGYVSGDPYHKSILVSSAQLFRQETQKSPQSISLNSYDQNLTFTYQQLLQKAEELATGLIRTFGLKPKDRIGIYAYNKWEWVVVQLAAALADLILVNINPAYLSDQLGYTINKVDLSVLFMNDKFKQMDYIQVVKTIIPDIQKNDSYHLKSDKFPSLKAVVRMNTNSTVLPGFVNFSDLLQPARRHLLPSKIDKDDPANIQFTSGTTGRPKAATLSHFNILNNAYLIGQKCRYTNLDNIAIPVPFYHCFGMILGTLGAFVRGAQITIVTEGFDAKKTLEAVSKYKATSLYGVPTMFIEYLKYYEANPSLYKIDTLRTGIIAGALCSQQLMTKIIHDLKLKDMTNCYGMTQTSPVSFQTCPTDPFHRKTTTVGRILPGLQAKIVRPDGTQCKSGQAGEFWVRGWSVMLNYWGDQHATKKSIEQGWMKSGDMGVIDHQGYLSIVGRLKDMIIRGGENIYPKQIQEFLVKKQGILDAQVVAVSDQKYGQQVAAVIKLKDPQNGKITKEDVFNYCKNKIAFYKIPKYIKFVTDYPLTVSGKVQKYIIRNQLESEKKEGKISSYKVK